MKIKFLSGKDNLRRHFLIDPIRVYNEKIENEKKKRNLFYRR